MTAIARSFFRSGSRFLPRLILSLICLFTLTANQCPSYAQSEPGKPSLVVLIVADQFPYNFLARYKDKFQAGGLRLLMDQGAHYPNCKYDSATTHSNCGASIIATGAHPWHTGVVGNTWYSRGKRASSSATADDSAQMVGANGTAGSNKVSGTSIGDQLKLASNGRSKVFSIAGDQSVSLLLGGRLANSVFWLDSKSGNMVSSSKYGGTLTGWVKAFNDLHYPDKYLGKPWQRVMNENQYGASTRDDYPYERTMTGDGKVFPHVIQAGSQSAGQDYYENFVMTPFADQMVIDFAKEAMEKEFLGQHADADLLILGLSAGEKLTQYFGPYSQETEDLVLRMDQNLASLFQLIDSKVGMNKCMIVFTSSHGSPAIPEFSKERGLDSGRIDPKVFTTFLDAKLDSSIGHDDWIEAFDPPNLYLNLDAVDKQKLRQPDVESLVSRVAHSIPGIGEVFTAWQFYTNQPPNSPLSDKVRKSYFFGRSGELYVAPKPGWVFISESTGTGFGSPYTYDSQVPLLLFGAGIKAGRYGADVSPADVAPTIAACLGIEAPSVSEGTPLVDAMQQTFAQSPKPTTQPVPEEDPNKDKKKRR